MADDERVALCLLQFGDECVRVICWNDRDVNVRGARERLSGLLGTVEFRRKDRGDAGVLQRGREPFGSALTRMRQLRILRITRAFLGMTHDENDRVCEERLREEEEGKTEQKSPSHARR